MHDKKEQKNRSEKKIALGEEEKAIIRKQTKKIIIMGIILIILIAAYFILGELNKKRAQEESQPEEKKVFLTTDTSTVTKLSYTYKGAEYSYRKDGDQWISEEDESLDLDEEKIEKLIGNLASIEYSNMIEGALDLDEYGLSEGYETIKWTNAEGNYEVHVGSKNAITSEYYLLDASNGDICTVKYAFVSAYHNGPEDYLAQEDEDK